MKHNNVNTGKRIHHNDKPKSPRRQPTRAEKHDRKYRTWSRQ
ncbi:MULTISPECIES: hypothetical protein [Deinococcus]|uniref:Uncharacterized protein n=2 Tax=Deinococcus TaxID=1298 RepID=H8H310_DEIGI|nr:hypothetical protein [Deinococcus gobiensis]AFD27907.1 hypothetical protein DGo_PC0115 [Deinococcus gobiensis I-0]